HARASGSGRDAPSTGFGAALGRCERATERLADAAHRLPGSVLVLDEREAHVLVPVLAEADARRHRHLSLREQELRGLERTHGAEGLGNTAPDEHRRLRLGDLPAGTGETLAQHVAPHLVALGVLAHAVLRAVERMDGGDLDRLEHPVIEIALDARERV